MLTATHCLHIIANRKAECNPLPDNHLLTTNDRNPRLFPVSGFRIARKPADWKNDLVRFHRASYTPAPFLFAMSLRGELFVAVSQPAKYRLALALLVMLVMLQPGCVRRRLTIRSNPPGAMVFIDKRPIGTTPVSTNYIYYGTREITIVRDGFRTETVKRKFRPPWYEYPPLDFVSENLWPWELRDERVVDFQLVPQPLVRDQDLRNRAETLRGSAVQGHMISGPPAGQPNQFLPSQAMPAPQPEPSQIPPNVQFRPGSTTLPQSGIPYAPR